MIKEVTADITMIIPHNFNITISIATTITIPIPIIFAAITSVTNTITTCCNFQLLLFPHDGHFVIVRYPRFGTELID